jgi:hypothetical protein
MGIRSDVEAPSQSMMTEQQLGENENVIEVYIGHLRLEEKPFTNADDGTIVIPSVFISIDMLDHVTQMTDVLCDMGPTFDKTYMYTCTMDEFLLYFLQNKTLDFELCQSQGTSYTTIASANLSLVALLESQETLQGFAPLRSARWERVGQLEFAIRILKPLPPDWVIIAASAATTDKAAHYRNGSAHAAGTRRSDGTTSQVGRRIRTPFSNDIDAEAIFRRLSNVSSITVHVLACSNLQTSAPIVAAEDGSHSSFVPYVFYTLYETDITVEIPTNITASASVVASPPHHDMKNPQFHHCHEFPCEFTSRFIAYLSEGVIPFTVFNDHEENEDNYVGFVKIKLRPMLEGPNSKIQGTFPLLDPHHNQSTSGLIEICILWNTDDTVKAVLPLNTELALLQLKE